MVGRWIGWRLAGGLLVGWFSGWLVGVAWCTGRTVSWFVGWLVRGYLEVGTRMVEAAVVVVSWLGALS